VCGRELPDRAAMGRVCGRELPDRAAMGTTVICHNVPWVGRRRGQPVVDSNTTCGFMPLTETVEETGVANLCVNWCHVHKT